MIRTIAVAAASMIPCIHAFGAAGGAPTTPLGYWYGMTAAEVKRSCKGEIGDVVSARCCKHGEPDDYEYHQVHYECYEDDLLPGVFESVVCENGKIMLNMECMEGCANCKTMAELPQGKCVYTGGSPNGIEWYAWANKDAVCDP